MVHGKTLFTMSTSIKQYYLTQAGSGLQHIGPIYKSPRKYQQGFGIGSFLGNVISFLRPYAAKGIQSMAELGYKTTKGLMEDLIDNKSWSDSVRKRGKEAVLNLTESGLNTLKRKMGKQAGQGGRGINKRVRRRKTSVGGRRRTKTKQIGGRRRRKAKRRTKKRVLDIFT